MAGQPECWLFWARAGLKSSDLREMFPSTRASARTSVSAVCEIVHAGSGAKRKRPKGAPKMEMAAVPVVDMHAGTSGRTGGQFSDFDTATAEGMIAASAFWCPNPAQMNCLRVQGTATSPLINDGDIVAVDGSQTDPEELSRKIVVAWHRNKGLSLARFIAADGVHMLESENRDFNPVAVEKDRTWQIVGQVLWRIRKGPCGIFVEQTSVCRVS